MSYRTMPESRRFLGAYVIGLTVLCALISGCGIGSGRPSLQSAPVHYLVRAGDTLQTIAAQSGVSPTRIALLNGLRDPDRIRAGQRLFLGYRNSLAGAAPRHEVAGRIVHASLNGRGAAPGRPARLSWPVPGGRLSSRFGPRNGSFHDGLDIAAKRGTPVLAAHDAVVIYSDDGLSGYGNLIILRAPDGLTTVYGHNRRNLVRVGQTVERGEQIAEVGTTGRASGPHLHFEVRARDGRGRYVAVDPAPLLGNGSKYPPRYRVNERLTPILARVLSSN